LRGERAKADRERLGLKPDRDQAVNRRVSALWADWCLVELSGFRILDFIYNVSDKLLPPLDTYAGAFIMAYSTKSRPQKFVLSKVFPRGHW